MQDSPTNPFIPQQNQAIRSQTETLHSPLKRIVKILLIVTLVLAILIGAGLFFVIPRTTVDDKEARVALGNTLQEPGKLSKLVPVKSSLGFSLKYDNQMLTSYAETVPLLDKDGKPGISAYFENDDLRTPRDYNVVRITPAESTDSDRAAVTDPPQLIVSSTVTSADLKANEAKPDYKGLSQLSLFVQMSTEKRLAAKTADDGTTVSIEASKPSSQTINDVKYQLVRYTTKNENYRIVNHKYDDCYYTIQNDMPIAACITNVRPNSADDAALSEQVLQSLSYQKSEQASEDEDAPTDTAAQPTISDKSSSESSNKVVQTKEVEPLPLETVKPEYNMNSISLAAIAKNQPSVVRIGTLYCADLNLKLASGDIATTLTDACVSNLSSGTFVSKDGHIATTGHAIRYDPKDAINGYINFADSQKDLLSRLDRVLDYLLKARLILDSDADYLKTGAQIGDQEALAKIENISSIIPDDYVTPVKDQYSYAIQPTDKPLVLDTSTGSRPSFAYSDTVISAKFIASDYDALKSAQESFDSATPPKDVGLLKAEGSFQNVFVAPGDVTKSNDILNIIGYPAFSGSSLVIGKNQNAPVVTSGKVNQTYEKDNQRLIQLEAPIIPGNDGAGAFNKSGELIGFGVYGLSYCPDQRCFATGTIRSSNELLNLLDSNNMTLGPISDATTTWQNGVDAYMKGDYTTASSKFASAGSQYRFNVFAEPLQKLAASKKGSASDTSLMNQLVGVMIAAVITMSVLTLLFAAIYILQRRRLDSLRVGHYGAQTQQVVPTSVAQPQYAQPQYTQQQPQQPRPLSTPYQQQYPQQSQQYAPQQQPYAQQQQSQPQPYAPQSLPQYPQTQPQPNQQQPQPPQDPFYRQ